jgi:AcrR family transcriptional regulator
MDRRQRKTREAIFRAFTLLLSEKPYSKITIQEIIYRADIGRTTFHHRPRKKTPATAGGEMNSDQGPNK